MMPSSRSYAGRLEEHQLDSTALRGNVLGDPHVRPLWVYTPPGYEDSQQRYPSVYVIQGYTGQLTMWANRVPFRTPFPDAADAVFRRDPAAGCIVVYVDAWTAYGGSQFVDSPGTGRYHSYLCDEVVPWVDAHYRTIPERESRAISGKSSGGFGAMITPMLRPDLFSALATHAGDSLYELCYVPEFGKAVRLLREWDGDIQAWWSDFRSRVAFTREGDDLLLITLGCTAAFSAESDGTPVLPFDPRSGVLIPDVWRRWLDWDPVRMVPTYADAVGSWTAVWIDAGTRDEWFLDLGAQAFRNALAEAGVPDDRVAFELFDAAHGGIDYRYPVALEWLAGRLAR
jgi:S-formylglutathione hydrolase FrmB